MNEMEDLEDTLCFGDGRAADFHTGVGASSGFGYGWGTSLGRCFYTNLGGFNFGDYRAFGDGASNLDGTGHGFGPADGSGHSDGTDEIEE
jgi:hypothetical protein